MHDPSDTRNLIEETLDQLQAFVLAHAERAFFNPAADEPAISAVEEKIRLRLPKSYRTFLRRFDGGFINISRGSRDIRTARWNSNWLFGTADLIQQSEKARSSGGWDKIGFIPFCQTTGQEFLAFVPAKDDVEPPVLDAFHEASEWRQLYPNFTALLQEYVKSEGVIRTIAMG